MKRSFLVGWLAAAVACGATTAPDMPGADPAAAVVAAEPDAAAVTSAPSDGPACSEGTAEPAPWPRATGFVRVQPTGKGPARLTQSMVGAAGGAELRFFGTHVFDLLDKTTHEGGDAADRRRLVCTVLEAVARSGAPVVRLWGSLKRTGDDEEVEVAADSLELVLDENARRARPLRFVVTLLNHQAGYGSPRPEASLDDQDPKSGWNARTVYLEDGWRAGGRGQLARRIERFAARERLRASPYVLAWELVNELDTFRVANSGSFSGAEADRLRDAFLVPATELLAAKFEQPIAIGELRGHAGPAYVAWARSIAAALSPGARQRLAWTSHVYAPRGGDLQRATAKLDLDLAISAELGLPFLLGEVGQHVPGTAASFCGDGPLHELGPLFGAVLEARPRSELRAGIDKALFWGEGLCGLTIEHPAGRRQPLRAGAGGDTADLAPGDSAARAALIEQRKRERFSIAK